MNEPKKLAVIGWPVTHSRSPLIHNFWIQQLGFNAIYERWPIHPTADFAHELEKMRECGFVGANVTVPHKETAFQAIENHTLIARRLQAVNVIKFTADDIFGDNTDGAGFLGGLGAQAETKHPMLILGAGGAARAIIAALAESGASEIRIANRSRDKAEAVATLGGTAARVVGWQARGAAAEQVGLVVNATTLGMAGQPPLHLPLDKMRPGGVVCDIVYTPLETPLLRAAREMALRTVDGLAMLLHQAALAFEIWFGVRPAVDARLRALVVADLNK